jgi:hypothetical protein
MKDKLTALLQDDIVQTALWIGVSAAITAIGSFLLDKPELAPYYGVINFVLYALKKANERRATK